MSSLKVNFDSKRNKAQSKVNYYDSENGLNPQTQVRFTNNIRPQQSNTYWDKQNDSLNESFPDVKHNEHFECTAENLKKKMTARTMQKNILKEEEDGLTAVLNKVYFHACCPYFYFFIAIFCTFMILWVIIQGKEAIRTFVFKAFEVFINLFILGDIACKIFLIGCEAYFIKLSNILEFSIGLVCVLIYFLYYLSTTFDRVDYNELLENVVFCCWCIWQIFRIVTLFYKQRKASRTEADNISFSKFHDEIDHNSFVETTSRKESNHKKSIGFKAPKVSSRSSSIRADNKVSQSLCE
ncbi:unnamed protein product [Moneuplotes crassus]|uniref:Uncharacterized protein n=1 Tax=Euplotes crassus TaxID=5936 RepID=A0AAD1UNN7_EUPCR|nr:unnamed protein product [Moneuplotes crassus]